MIGAQSGKAGTGTLARLAMAAVLCLGLAGVGVARAELATAGVTTSTAGLTSVATWTPTLIDNPRGAMLSVSCPAVGQCMAVDAYGNAVRQSGSGWARPERISAATLVSVSCPTVSFCAAVGVNALGTDYAVTYDGSRWGSPVILEFTAAAPVIAVSCISSMRCVAVDVAGRTLTYNGSTWGSPVLVSNGGFTAIACVSATFCAATDGSGGLLRYANGRWTLTPGVLVQAAENATLACTSVSFCLATDGAASAVLGANGTWSRAALPFSVPLNRAHIACVAATYCVLTAALSPGTWTTSDGHTWHAQAPSPFQSMAALSCTGPANCTAVGSTGVDAEADSAAVLDGQSWGAAVSADPIDDGRLQQVECPSTSRCVAVDWAGYFTIKSGASWTYPKPVPGVGGIGGVRPLDCPTAAFCMGLTGGKALVLKGSTWSKPVFVTTRHLMSLSCASATMCLALDDISEAFLYNGTRWTKLTGTPQGLGPGPVDCPAATFCLAVTANLVAPALTTFNGHSWSTPRPVHVNPDDTSIHDLSCSSPKDCTAIGTGGGAARLVGTTWHESITFDEPNGPDAISCVATALCQVIDSNGQILSLDAGQPGPPTKVEGFNGVLGDVSCATATSCVVVDWSGLAFSGP